MICNSIKPTILLISKKHFSIGNQAIRVRVEEGKLMYNPMVMIEVHIEIDRLLQNGKQIAKYGQKKK